MGGMDWQRVNKVQGFRRKQGENVERCTEKCVLEAEIFRAPGPRAGKESGLCVRPHQEKTR